MNPVLFSADASSWDSFGIGVLSDAISCTVEEERNGAYELEMEYPITGAFYAQIGFRSLIVAKPNFADNPQPFRVYQISKPLNGIVTINAEHISYDLSGYANDTFTAQGIQAAMSGIISGNTRPVNCPFIFSSDMSKTQTMSIGYPVSIRAAMGGIAGSMIDVYGGEWHFDGYHCSLNAARGTNRGVKILYGKNLTSLVQEANNANVYTAVMPYYYNKDTGDRRVLTEKVVQVPGTFSFQRVLPLDLTSEFEELPTEAQLRTRAAKYIEDNNIGVPKVNLTVGFQYLEGLADRIDLCDTVSVGFDALGVSATAKCIRTKWDVLKDRYIEVELGSARKSLAGTIAETSEIAREITKYSSEYKATTERIANTVTGNTGGYIVLNDTDNDGKPDEILIMDSPSKETAVNVIRMNSSGIAFSKTGYNGTYSTAWNINSEFSADFIASGKLKTNLVEIFGDAQFRWDNANIEIIKPKDDPDDPDEPLKIIRLGKYDGINYGLGFSTDSGQTWKAGFNFDGIIADMITSGVINASLITTGILDAGLLKAGTISTNLVTIAGSNQFKWSNEYIEITNPSNTNQIIRFGKYDGTNYGMGFSIDGGETWISGYDFNGISAIGGVSKGRFAVSGDTITMLSQAGVALLRLGITDFARDIYDNTVTNIIYQIGSYAAFDVDDAPIAEPARGAYGISIGDYMLARGVGSICIGRTSKALGEYSIAMGYRSQAKDDYGIAIGFKCRSVGNSSIAFGDRSEVEDEYGIAIGFKSKSKRIGIAIGHNAIATELLGTAIGYYAKANSGSVAIGDCECLGENGAAGAAVAIGKGCKTNNAVRSIAIGAFCETSAGDSIAIGYTSKAKAVYSLALGYMDETNGLCSVALGYKNTTNGNHSVALGNNNSVSGQCSSVIGGGKNSCDGNYGIVGGYENGVASGNDCCAVFGQGNTANSSHQFICGAFSSPGTTHRLTVGRGTSDSARNNAMYVEHTGNMWIAGTLTQASDRRLKKITGDAPDLSSVRAVKFEWKDKDLQDSAEHIGYIAQDVEEIAPYLVKEDASGTKSLDYIAVLCAKVEMLEKQNAEKEQRISDLEQLVSKLTERLESLEGRLA